MAKSDTRKRLVSSGISVFLKHGYEGGGITAILNEAGMPKGSFYNLFPSKEEFACAALDAYFASFTGLRAETLCNSSLTPCERLKTWLTRHREYIEQQPETAGCLAGILGQTGAVHHEKIRQKLLALFNRWERDLIDLFREAQLIQTLSPTLTPESAAAMVIHLYEGVMIRIRMEATTSPYDFLIQTLPEIIFVH
ncbi:TetR/AcrR family transcriptional regulator [Erwinia sp. MMLR14_017]|uniref:TetR/AcrR family transcriptional regulator n=1 Tax=Erwinia sp. MMLR14_017 TaxID=3093842 RepID=UPI00299079F9|nr:TetR/AcrR family transcriptional regulator [Erwinia sp. MMLR14_017]MDW8845036.1 TetR/AcrR family transcriptional regulator [Erwinia sp. MMLR14_017]